MATPRTDGHARALLPAVPGTHLQLLLLRLAGTQCGALQLFEPALEHADAPQRGGEGAARDGAEGQSSVWGMGGGGSHSMST